MVIRYLHIKGVAFVPHETYAELIVDPDTVLARSIMAQRLQLIPRRQSQVFQSCGCEEHRQLLLRHVPQTRRRHPLTGARGPEFLRTLIREGLDHCYKFNDSR